MYLIRTRQGHLYTGITTDVERRFEEHQRGSGAKYLRSKGPLQLVYDVEIGGRSLASKAEYAIKGLPKAKKEAIVAQQLNRKQMLRALNLGDD